MLYFTVYSFCSDPGHNFVYCFCSSTLNGGIVRFLCMDFKVMCNPSSTPWLSSWQALDTLCLIPSTDMKFDLWSVWMHFGKSNVEKNLTSAFTTGFALNERSRVASGKRVATYKVMSTYWRPSLVLLSQIRIGCEEAGGINFLSLPPVRHIRHDRQYLATSDWNPGQRKWRSTLSWVFLIPKCPDRWWWWTRLKTCRPEWPLHTPFQTLETTYTAKDW